MLGEGILASRFIGFKEHAGEIKKRDVWFNDFYGPWKSNCFSLWTLQERGTLYVEHGDSRSSEMVIGNVTKGDENDSKSTKGKQLSNMRASWYRWSYNC